MIKICKNCNSEFKTSHATSTFCCKSCYSKYVGRKIISCKNCNIEFKAKSEESKFCCKSCYTEYANRLTLICENCNTEFKGNEKSRFCTKKCHIENLRKEKAITITCKNCNIEYKGDKVSKFCSRECYLQYGEGLVTIGNPDVLEIIKFSHRERKGKTKYWEVKCKICGETKLMAQTSLKISQSCGCQNYTHGDKHFSWTGEGELSGTFFNALQHHAKKRNINFDVNKQFLWDLFVKQDKKCALSGVDLSLGQLIQKGKKSLVHGHTASLDRIDSNGDYTEDNVQWVHIDINFMKQQFEQSYFIRICDLITNYEPKEQNNDLPIYENNNKHPNWRGEGELSGTFWANIVKQAKRREIPFLLSKKFLWNLFVKQNMKCALSGINLSMGHLIYKNRHSIVKERSASLDRIDSDGDYTEDNVQWVHKDVNIMKYSLKETYFVNMCKLVSENNKEIDYVYNSR